MFIWRGDPAFVVSDTGVYPNVFSLVSKSTEYVSVKKARSAFFTCNAAKTFSIVGATGVQYVQYCKGKIRAGFIIHLLGRLAVAVVTVI